MGGLKSKLEWVSWGWYYYSLGNFVFDQYWNESVRCGAVVIITLVAENDSYTVEERFVKLQKDGTTIPSSCRSEVPIL